MIMVPSIGYQQYFQPCHSISYWYTNCATAVLLQTAAQCQFHRSVVPNHGSAALRTLQVLFIHPPTAPIMTITATRRMASSTVYSINDAPSSSRLNRLMRFATKRMVRSLFAPDASKPSELHHYPKPYNLHFL